MADWCEVLVLPVEVMLDCDLSDPERRVLSALYYQQGKAPGKFFIESAELCRLSHVNSETYLSRITGRLCERGWLTKKRRGYPGRVSYQLHVPSRLRGGVFHRKPVLHSACKNQTIKLSEDSECCT